MKIGFDISQTCESKSGTGFFSDQLIRALAEVDQENEYILFPHFYDYRPQDTKAATHIHKKNFKNRIISDFSDHTKEIADLDIIHSNNFRFPKDTCAKKIVTIYDVCFLEYPEYTTEANRLFCYQGTLDSMLYADKIIAISEYTKQRLIHFFPFVDERKIEVVYCGNRDTLLTYHDKINSIKKYNLMPEQYFLSVGTIEPRKNYETLLKAYKEYLSNSQQHKKLCIAGGYGWLEDDFRQKIEALGLENDVVVTGYVSEEDLANLYRYCFAFIYPTWYEGFGMPVLEAMNFGKIVIASNVTSIPEVVGNAGILVEPGDVQGISHNMLRIEKDKQNPYTLLVRERVQMFSWKNEAHKLFEIYKSLSLRSVPENRTCVY